MLLVRCLFAAILLDGCSFMPAHVRPPLPVAEAWDSAVRPTINATRPARWQEFFIAPDLKMLIGLALDNNRDLRVAIGRVAASRGQYRVQRADLVPQLGVGADGSRKRTPADLSLTGRSTTVDTFDAPLSASWELDLWGRVRSLDTAALNVWLATDEARRTVALTLIADVARNWISARALDERIRLADRTIDSRRESVRITSRRFQLGAASELDPTQAQTLLAQAESAVISLQQERDLNRNALTLLVGAPIPLGVMALSDVQEVVVRDQPPGLPSDLLEDRPDVRGAENRLRAAEANIGAARAAFFPRIALTADYGTASAALDGLFSGSSSAWTVAANLTAPLFSGGRLTGNLDTAEAQKSVAVADYERTIQSAFRDVADALAARRWLGQQAQAQQRILDVLNRRSSLANLRYLSGAATYLEVLDAQRDLFNTEQSQVDTLRERLASEVSLFAALGGGHEDPSGRSAVAISKPSWWAQ